MLCCEKICYTGCLTLLHFTHTSVLTSLNETLVIFLHHRHVSVCAAHVNGPHYRNQLYAKEADIVKVFVLCDVLTRSVDEMKHMQNRKMYPIWVSTIKHGRIVILWFIVLRSNQISV